MTTRSERHRDDDCLRACESDGNCTDSSLCTTDTCVLGVCVNAQKNCNDNRSCTVNDCNAGTGACINTPDPGIHVPGRRLPVLDRGMQSRVD